MGKEQTEKELEELEDGTNNLTGITKT